MFSSDSGDPLLEKIKVQNASIFFPLYGAISDYVQLNGEKKSSNNDSNT